MYKCLDCGCVFDEPISWSESRGEYWGMPCSEEVSGCPYCKGDYEEAYKCEECNEFFLEEELHSDLCEECVKKKFYNIETCYKVGRESRLHIELNGFLASLFNGNEAEIEYILIEEIKKSGKITFEDFDKFAKDGFEEFVWIAKEVNKNENIKG